MGTAASRASASGGASSMMFDLPLQLAGPILAVVTFLTIWWGHIMVRIVHYYFGVRPAPIIFGVGLLLLLISTQVGIDVLSAGLGIVGLTMLWDSFELHRQEARVRQGHAPLNPACIAKQRGFSQPQSPMAVLPPARTRAAFACPAAQPKQAATSADAAPTAKCTTGTGIPPPKPSIRRPNEERCGLKAAPLLMSQLFILSLLRPHRASLFHQSVWRSLLSPASRSHRPAAC